MGVKKNTMIGGADRVIMCFRGLGCVCDNMGEKRI